MHAVSWRRFAARYRRGFLSAGVAALAIVVPRGPAAGSDVVLDATFAADVAGVEDDGEGMTVEVLTEHPQPMLAAATARYRPVRLSGNGGRTEAILESLAATDTNLSFSETPLGDWIAAIAGKAGIDAGLDVRALEDAGIDLDSPVSGGSAGRPLRDAIRSMLDPLGLTMVVRHGRLLVTTLERSQDPAYLERFLYPILPGDDPEEFRDLIESIVAPETWDSVGGTATARPLPSGCGSGLVVSQTEENHERIAAVLGGLDAAIWEGRGSDSATAPPRIVRTYPFADAESRSELAGRLVDLCNASMPEGRDPEAAVTVVGDSLVVQSSSRAFHVMAAAIITSIDGVDTILIENADDEDSSETSGTVQATSLRRSKGGVSAGARRRMAADRGMQ